jgi:hypothetical protein
MEPKYIVIIDDMIEKEIKKLLPLTKVRRQYNINIIIITHSYKELPKNMRSSTDSHMFGN